VKAVGFSFTMKAMVICRKPFILEIIDPLSLGKSSIFKLATSSSIILFDWVRKNKTANFFVVSTSGIQILLIDEQSLAVKKGPSSSSPVLNAWFDGIKQYLAVTYLDSPTELKIFDLNKIDEGMNFKHPAFQLELRLGIDQQSLPLFSTNQYHECIERASKNNTAHVIDFINLYNESFILHIDSEQGELLLYEVGGIGCKSVKILAESKGGLSRPVPVQHR
jgi:hypothetical protein